MDDILDFIKEAEADMFNLTDKDLLNWIKFNFGVKIELPSSDYFLKSRKEFMKVLWDIYGDEFKEEMKDR